jgi:hypothetical protein
VFIYVTGGAIINPTNRDWLMFGDAAQHYLGWEFFRHTPLLQWPIGANYPLGMELSSSIVFTDSIPIAAYIAKLFNPILPATFQYLGIWIWLCFVLQAFFAQRFLWFFLSNKAHVYLGACFVVLSPPLIYRLVHAGYGHIALASHWLILASFCLYLRPGRILRSYDRSHLGCIARKAFLFIQRENATSKKCWDCRTYVILRDVG